MGIFGFVFLGESFFCGLPSTSGVTFSSPALAVFSFSLGDFFFLLLILTLVKFMDFRSVKSIPLYNLSAHSPSVSVDSCLNIKSGLNGSNNGLITFLE